MTPDLQHVSALGVYLHGCRAGVLTRLSGDQHLFAFEQDYLDLAHRPTLSLAYKSASGGLVTRARPTRHRLPPFFSNLLPEGHLRAYLAAKADVKPEREFHLLAILGRDLSGAVVIRPWEGAPSAPLQNEPGHSAKPTRPGILHFSLAGIQLKFPANQDASGAFTIPAQGVGGDWIVKLPSPQCPAVPENEFAMLELARAIGIQVPPARLVPVAEIGGLPVDSNHTPGSALAVQRFDRAPNGQRVHMEDFAQIFGHFPEDKDTGRSYSNIAAVLWAETPGDGIYDFVRRLAFSVLIGNGNMHLKNWAVLHPEARTPVLAPAYDYVSTLPYIADDRLALSFGGSRALDGITLDQVRRFADTAGLPMKPVWDTIHSTAQQTVLAWKSLPQKDLLPPRIRLTIGAQIRRVSAALAAA